jgi:hypothetical protein
MANDRRSAFSLEMSVPLGVSEARKRVWGPSREAAANNFCSASSATTASGATRASSGRGRGGKSNTYRSLFRMRQLLYPGCSTNAGLEAELSGQRKPWTQSTRMEPKKLRADNKTGEV